MTDHSLSTDLAAEDLREYYGEARVSEHRFAEGSGVDLCDVRRVIEANMEELKTYGGVFFLSKETADGSPRTEYSLSKEQAIVVWLLLGADLSKVVRREFVDYCRDAGEAASRTVIGRLFASLEEGAA